MLKKSIVVLVTLLVVGFVVIPLVQAQDFAAMQRELEQIQADLAAGRITQEQAALRMNEINQKYLGGAGSVGGMPQGSTSGSAAGQAQNQRIVDQAYQNSWLPQEQQQESFPTGDSSGWPSASHFTQVSLPNLRQPAGTTVSYDYESDSRMLSVYIRGGTQAHLDALSREISGGNDYRGQTQFRITRPLPSGFRGASYFYVDLELQNGGIVLITGGGG